MTLAERVEAYRRAFPGQPASWPWIVQEQGREVFYAVWLPGPDFRNRTPLYGAYPPRYLDRVLAFFPDLVTGRVLHAFSGSLPPGPYTRVDLHTWHRPDVAADVQALPFADGTFDLVCADPPYSPADAHVYQTPMVNRRRATTELARVLRPGGFLIWLDTCWPMHQKAHLSTIGRAFLEPDGWELEDSEWATTGKVYLVRSTNHRFRGATIFERRAA